MEDHVVQFVISVDDTQPSFLLVRKVFLIPVDQFVEKWYLSYLFSCVNIDRLGLYLGNTGQGLDLARKVVRGWSKISKPYVNRVKGRQRSKSLHSGNPARRSSTFSYENRKPSRFTRHSRRSFGDTSSILVSVNIRPSRYSMM